MQKLRFENHLTPRPRAKGIDVATQLKHFAIITYAIDPGRLAGIIPERFRLVTVEIDGQPKALLSVVPFVNAGFRSAAYPSPRVSMAQVNYRVYIIDSETGANAVWFLGSILDSWMIVVPRYVWKLPWQKGTIRISYAFDTKTELYDRYEMTTKNEWAPARVQLAQTGDTPLHLEGFPDVETGLIYLSHPLIGFYYRRDGKLGINRVWHDRLHFKPATVKAAHFDLLDRLELVSVSEQATPHSVLIRPTTEFMSVLPPSVVR